MDPVSARDCTWGHEADKERNWRANLMTTFLTDSTPKKMHGVVLVETHDISSSRLPYKKFMKALGLPILVMDAHVVDKDVVLIPDVYYIDNHGYEKLNDKVDNASQYLPWSKKVKQVRWRGASTGIPPQGWNDVEGGVNSRVTLAMLAKTVPKEKLDAALVNLVQVPNDEDHQHVATALKYFRIVKSGMSMSEMVGARGIIDVDGNSNSWDGLWWKLRSNSVVLKVTSKDQQWYYPRLKPWVHYVPIAPDFSDLLERVEFVTDPRNDEELLRIVNASTTLMKELTYEAEAVHTQQKLIPYLVADSEKFLEVHKQRVEQIVESIKTDSLENDANSTGAAWFLRVLEHAVQTVSHSASGSSTFRKTCGEAAGQLKMWRDCGGSNGKLFR